MYVILFTSVSLIKFSYILNTLFHKFFYSQVIYLFLYNLCRIPFFNTKKY